MLPDAVVREIFHGIQTIAVVGAKDTPGQAVDRVGRYLIQAGYTVIPVHPKRREVWGLPVFPSLGEIGVPVDLVNVFRAPLYCADHAREALGMNPRPAAFWMQLGIQSPEARALLENSGIRVIEDACIMVEHARACRG